MSGDVYKLDKRYSTTRRVVSSAIDIINEEPTLIELSWFLEANKNRAGEGGLRTKGYFKNNATSCPLISIVTVVYNGEGHIEQTIQSVISQEYENVEYIVIDGGSTDGTLDILKQYEGQIDYWVSEPDRGISDAFNKGVTLCQGEWVGLINADDWYEPQALSSILTYPDAEVLYGNMQVWRNGVKNLVHLSSHENMHKQMSLNHPSVFIRRRVYQRLGCFDHDFKLAMDYELLIRFLCNGVRFEYINQVLTNFRDGGASDEGQILALQEVKAAKLRYKTVSNWMCHFQYFLASNKYRLAIFIRKVGLTKMLDTYSRYFSPYKQK
jgi:glycosyltransferase involved in cell wall biosynthesis